MIIFEQIGIYFQMLSHIVSSPGNLALLFGSVLLGIMFGALPGLTSTLGIALLTAITYGMDTGSAMLCLLGIYVGGTYGGSYASILINIPGTAASAATALDGYPLSLKGKAGQVIGLSTTSSAIGTFISLLFLVSISPVVGRNGRRKPQACSYGYRRKHLAGLCASSFFGAHGVDSVDGSGPVFFREGGKEEVRGLFASKQEDGVIGRILLCGVDLLGSTEGKTDRVTESMETIL